ncbi:MAG: flavodoxin domain-containing protein, partial [Muribaculaceae bacterium]|nr:flavodoxin domain-containing protein [Muribaculaceae bacterium]
MTKKIVVFYASETGTTADVARRIAKELGVADADVHDVAK